MGVCTILPPLILSLISFCCAIFCLNALPYYKIYVFLQRFDNENGKSVNKHYAWSYNLLIETTRCEYLQVTD